MTIDQEPATTGGIHPMSKVALFISAGIVGLGLFIQFNVFLNHDVAYFLHSARDMLHGAVIGRDIVSTNPPMIWYLSSPPAALSELMDIRIDLLFRIYVITIGFFSIGTCYWIVQTKKLGSSSFSGAFFIIAACYFYFVGSYRDFGQREYLALALSLPYIMAAAARIKGVPIAWPLGIVLGIAAGLGLALKPNFLIVPILVELVVIFRTRSLRASFRSETWAIFGVGLAYAISVPLVAPDFLFEVIPMVVNAYSGYNSDLLTLVKFSYVEIFFFGFALYIWARFIESVLVTVLIAATVGFMISYFSQLDGFTYHSYPFRAMVAIVLAVELEELWHNRLDDKLFDTIRRLGVAVALIWVIGFNAIIVNRWFHVVNKNSGEFAEQTEHLIDLIDMHAGDGTFLTINTHPYPAFPVALHTTAKWRGTDEPRFLLPNIARSRADGISSESLDQAESDARRLFHRDLATEPDLVMVRTQPGMLGMVDIEFDALAFYLEDPEISDLWNSYRELEPYYRIRIFVRKEAGGEAQ